LDAAVDETRSLLTDAEAVTAPITKDTKPTMTAKKNILDVLRELRDFAIFVRGRRGGETLETI
jgi:hypothetical protein